MNNVENIMISGEIYGPEQLVNKTIAACLLGLSVRTIEGMSAKRELPMYKIRQGANRYRICELMEWIDDQKIC